MTVTQTCFNNDSSDEENKEKKKRKIKEKTELLIELTTKAGKMRLESVKAPLYKLQGCHSNISQN